MSDCHARDPGLILGRDNRCLAFFHLLHNQNILSLYGWIRVSLHEHLRTHATFIEDQIIIDFFAILQSILHKSICCGQGWENAGIYE